MNSQLVWWSRGLLLAGLVLMLVVVVPVAWFPLQLSKLALFAVLLAVAAVLLVVAGGARDLRHTPGFWWAMLPWLLPAAYVLSWAFSTERSVALLGSSLEADTLLFSLLAALAYTLSFVLFRTLRTARMLATVVMWTVFAAVLVQAVAILASYPINLVGKWNDLGILAALLVLVLCTRAELADAPTTLERAAAGVGSVVALVLLGLINFALAWALLLAGSLVLGLFVLMRRRADRAADAPRVWHHTVPRYAVAGVLLSILFLLYGAPLSASLARVFPVSSLEVRPGLQSTLDVASAARAGQPARALVGTGPGTFGEAWLAHRPVEVNQTPFWNLDFAVGYSILATAFATTGLLGALAWLLPLFLVLGALVRVVRLGVLSHDERMVALVLSFATAFLWLAIICYVPSQSLVVLAFVLGGATFGFLWRQGRSAPTELPTSSLLSVRGLALALVVLALFSGVATARLLVSQAYVGAGASQLAAGNVDQALADASHANSVQTTPDALQLQVGAGIQKLTALVANKTLSAEQARATFTDQLQKTIAAGQAAIKQTPRDYHPYLALARVYDFLAALKIQGAYQSAKDAYAAAQTLNPTSPIIALAQAKLEVAHGTPQVAQDDLKRALTLKTDYTDAILFVVQLDVARNDLAGAIRDTQVAVQTAPGVGSIWFQLGLLYYAGGDTKDAIMPLEQAIKLIPDYANAKYFLALSYYAQGRKPEAQTLFNALAVANPDNTDLKSILQNIAAGKTPLNATSTPPQNRPTAPVKQ